MANLNNVVVIDDDVEILELLPRLLAGSVFEADCAASAADFLALLRDKDYCAAIIDFWLEDETSLDLLDRVEEIAPGLPIIVMSGGGGGHSAEVAEALGNISGATEFLHKPFRRDELLQKLDLFKRA